MNHLSIRQKVLNTDREEFTAAFGDKLPAAWSRKIWDKGEKGADACNQNRKVAGCRRFLHPSILLGLFVSQRDDWIDAHGAARGDIAR